MSHTERETKRERETNRPTITKKKHKVEASEKVWRQSVRMGGSLREREREANDTRWCQAAPNITKYRLFLFGCCSIKCLQTTDKKGNTHSLSLSLSLSK